MLFTLYLVPCHVLGWTTDDQIPMEGLAKKPKLISTEDGERKSIFSRDPMRLPFKLITVVGDLTVQVVSVHVDSAAMRSQPACKQSYQSPLEVF